MTFKRKKSDTTPLAFQGTENIATSLTLVMLNIKHVLA
jgi:hypothetical protein